MRLPRFARNDPGMLEIAKLLSVTRNDPDLHEKGKKKVASFSGSHFFRS